MYSFESIFNELKKNSSVDFTDAVVPECPKHTDLSCKRNFTSCTQGLETACKQKISFCVAINRKTLRILYPKFYKCYNQNYHGVLRETDTNVLWLIENKIIDVQKLEKI